MSKCFKAGMADFCVLQEKRDGHFHFQHMLGVWLVRSHLHLSALTPKSKLHPFSCLLHAHSPITQLGRAIWPHHLRKQPLGQVCGQATQQHLLSNAYQEATLIAPSQLMDARLTHPFGRQWTWWSMWEHVACTKTSQCPVTQSPRDSKAQSDCSTLAAWPRALTPAVTTAQPMHRNREMTL